MYEDQYWLAADTSQLPARDRRSGPYRAYLPDRLSSRALMASPGLSTKAAEAEEAVREVSQGRYAANLEGMARFLLRSEAIASSLIEGIAPSPQQVALAELAQEEDVRGFSEQAKLVANNITVLRRASRELVDAHQIGVGDIVGLHSALLPDEQHQGLRTVRIGSVAPIGTPSRLTSSRRPHETSCHSCQT